MRIVTRSNVTQYSVFMYLSVQLYTVYVTLDLETNHVINVSMGLLSQLVYLFCMFLPVGARRCPAGASQTPRSCAAGGVAGVPMVLHRCSVHAPQVLAP